MTAPSSAQIAGRWSAHAEQYHRWGDLAHGHPAYRQAWVEALTGLVGNPRRDGAPALRIADVGTGTAEVALLLADMGHDVTGYDIAAGMLDQARSRAATSGVAIRFAHGDAYHLPLADETLDVVINRMVFWTLYDPPRALLEWRRALVPGGRIIVIDALHFRAPTTALERASQLRSRLFWGGKNRLVRLRDRIRYGARGGRLERYRADAVQPPGMSWQSVADAHEQFVQAGMDDVVQGWLDTVHEVDRRTAALHWRLAGRLARFFTLTWRRP